MWPISLALGAAAIWGVSDFLAAVRARHYGPLLVAAFAQLTGTVLLVVAYVAVRDPFPGWGIWAPGIVAGIAGSVGHVVFIAALARGPIGVVAPILAMSSAGPVLVAIGLQGERPAPLQLLGLLLAVIGVTLVSRAQHDEAVGPSRFGAVPIALLGVAILTVFYVAMDAASQESALWGVMAQRSISLPLLLLGLMIGVRWGAERVSRGAVRDIAPIGVMDTAALLGFALATSMGELSIAVVLSSLYPVVTILLARIRLQEQLAPIQRVGAVFAFAGVVAIVLG